jgi:hypothetical protein
MWIVHVLAQQRVLEEHERTLLDDPAALDRLFFDRTGYHPPPGSVTHRQWIVGQLLSRFAEMVETGETFQESVVRNYEEVKTWLDDAPLEIAEPGEGVREFLIGDSPAVALKAGWPGVGPLGGVTLSEATTMILPLGPRHLAAVGSAPQALLLDNAGVDIVNNAEVAHAIQGVYYRPGSGLGSFVTSVSDRGGAAPHTPESEVS